MGFEEWFSEVEMHMQSNWGISTADLPDYCYRDLYDDGADSDEAASEAYDHAFYS